MPFVRLVAGLALTAGVGLGGCGYRFALQGTPLPPGVGRLGVTVFENRSSEPEAGAIFADALAEALGRRGLLGDERSAAQLVGTVLDSSSYPAATGPRGTEVGLYRVVLRVRLALVQGGAERCVREVVSGEDFLPARDLLGLEARRREAIRRLAGRMMESAAGELCRPGDAS